MRTRATPVRPPIDLAWTALLLAVALAARTIASPLPAPPHHPLPQGVQDEPPALHRDYDVQSYDLALDIDPDRKTLAGRVDVSIKPARSDLNRVVLDLVANLVCDGVSRGEEQLDYRHDGDSLVIYLPSALHLERTDTLRVLYHGTPLPHGVFGAGFMWRSRDTGIPGDPSDDTPVVATVVEPWSAHSWWPCRDDPSDKALVSLDVTVPAPLRVIANGTLLRDEPAPGGKRRFVWREAYPIATYLVSVAITEYASWSEECLPPGGAPVRLDFHAFAEDSVKAAFDLAPTCAMLEMMTDIAGSWPFPGEKYAQAEIKWIGAMEHQTATSISQFMLTGDRANETLVIHELAHQWYGDSLTPRTWPDIWLNEGFARYCEGLWLERTYGEDAYRDFMHRIGPVRHPDMFAGEGILSAPDPVLPNLLIYDKGAWVLHLLRLRMGDEAFFGFLRDYAQDPALALGGTNEAAMTAHAEQAAGSSLAAFFAPLLDTDAVPVIQAEASVREGRLTLSQLQDPPFELPVPVRLFGPGGSEDRTLLLDARTRTFDLSGFGPLDSLQVDPDTLTLMIRSPAPARTLDIRGPAPNPAPAAVFEIFLKETSYVTADIYDIKGRLTALSGRG